MDKVEMRSSTFTSLRFRLFALVLLALIPAVIFMLYIVLVEYREAKSQAQDELLRLTQLVAGAQQETLENSRGMLAVVTTFNPVRRAIQGGDRVACTARLAELAALNPDYIGFGVWDLQGDLICADLTVSSTVNIADRLWFRLATETRDFSIGEFQISRPSLVPAIAFGYPVVGEEGQLLAVVSTGLDLAAFSQTATNIPLPPDTILILVDHKGIILTRNHDPEIWMGKSLPEDTIRRIILTQETGVAEAMGADGVRRVYAFTPATGPAEGKVLLITGRAIPDIYQAANRALVRYLVWVSLVLLLILATIWTGSWRLIFNPLGRLMNATQALSQGNLDIRSQIRHDNSEVGHLALAFDEMAAALQQRQEELEHLHQAEQQARREAEKNADRLARLQTVTAALSVTLTPEQVADVITEQTCATLDAATCAVFLLDEARALLISLKALNYHPKIVEAYKAIPLDAPLPGPEVIRTRQPLWFETNQALLARYPQLAEVRVVTNHEAVAILPLSLDDHILGAMSVGFAQARSFNEEDQALLKTLAQQCAQALERARLYQETRQLNVELEKRVAQRTTELERMVKELDQFTYIASHDLKAPLRGVKQLSTWIVQDAGNVLPEASKVHLGKLQGRIERMERLLNDLLLYSRVGRNYYKNAEKVDTGALVKEIVELLAPPPGFTVTLQEGMPILTTSRTPLELIFKNLIENAIKHHHRTDGWIQVSARELDDAIEFSVRDDGPGIDPIFHERIFQIFQTLKPRDEVEGTGMGLSIVKKAVESQGGRLNLVSAEGEGATFQFTWPKD